MFVMRLVLAHGKRNQKKLALMVGEDGNGQRGKIVCRAPMEKRMTKFVFVVHLEKTHDKVCVCRVPRRNARQTFFLPSVFFVVRVRKTTHGKHLGALKIWISRSAFHMVT
jgi:hypothetical protein